MKEVLCFNLRRRSFLVFALGLLLAVCLGMPASAGERADLPDEDLDAYGLSSEAIASVSQDHSAQSWGSYDQMLRWPFLSMMLKAFAVPPAQLTAASPLDVQLTSVSAEESSSADGSDVARVTVELPIDEPGVDEPSKDEPSIDEPSPDEPSIDDTSIGDPSIDDPSIDEPGVDEPSKDEPSIDEPSIDEPSLDEPTVDDTSIDDPSIDEPGVDEPGVDEPSEDELSDDGSIDEPSVTTDHTIKTHVARTAAEQSNGGFGCGRSRDWVGHRT